MIPPGTYIKRPQGKFLYSLTGERRTFITASRNRIFQCEAIAYDPALDASIGYRYLNERDAARMVPVEVMTRSTRGRGRKIAKGWANLASVPLDLNTRAQGGTMSIQSLKATAVSIDEQISALRTRTVTLQTDIAGELTKDPMPTEFVGAIRDYRFRSAVDEMPRHTMRVAVDGSLVLWVSCASDTFENNILRGMGFKSYESMAKQLNGKLMMVRRTDGLMYPERLMPDQLERDGIKLFDRYGRPLWEGAPVYCLETSASLGFGVVASIEFSGGSAFGKIEFPDRDEFVVKDQKNIVRLI